MHRPRIRQAALALALAPALAVSPARAQAPTRALEQALSGLAFREIGPAIMGGRVADIAANEKNPAEFYVGFATGGVWKTTNQGMSWKPVFDEESTASIGDVTLAPSNANIVWVGTGEPQNRQSSPWGDGVYRSTDGGRSWQHVGLRETRHIGRIVVHPADPEIAYVAAVGHLWGPNPERGVFRTTDGGKTWQKVLYVDENTGAIDLVMDPGDPKTLFAAMYQRRRTPWGFSASGPGSGLYRTTDGGASWKRLEKGLPKGDLGRIGLDIYRRDGNLVYAVVESNREGRGLYRSRDRGETWEKMSGQNPRPMYFSMVRIDPNDPERIYLGGVELPVSDDGGRSWREGDGARNIHVDHHALWIDPSDSRRIILGNDGGVASTFDRGETWRHHNNLAVGQFYAIGVDMGDPYRVCGGLQDNSSWCGPSQSQHEGGIRNDDWQVVSGGDGFYNRIDPTDPDIVFTESQNGNVSRLDMATGEAARIRPVRRPTAGDTTSSYRWNWSTPIHISAHDPATVYLGANHLLRSRDRGLTWEEASTELTRRIDRDTLPIMGARVDSTTLSRHDGVSFYGTITVIGESPLDRNVLYAGTDDGVLHVTTDGGKSWSDITKNVPELGHGMVVSAIEPSRHAPGRVYLAFDGHYSDDYRPYVYVSEDFGRKWKKLTAGLPDWSVNVVREHPKTAELLFLGNEVGVYASFDRGGSWTRLRGENFPTVPVDDIVIHPRDNDLVLGTHGRSIWILDDVAPLEQIAADRSALAAAARLFPVRPATKRARHMAWDFYGDSYGAPNPPDAARIRYWLREALRPVVLAANSGPGAGPSAKASGPREELPRKASGDEEAPKTKLTVVDAAGKVVRTLEGPGEAGLHEVFWDLRLDPPYTPDPQEPQGRGRFGGAPRGPLVLPGTYTVRLEAAGVTRTVPVEVRYDPRITVARADLEARQAALLELHALARPLYEAGRAARAVDERVKAAQKLLRGAGGEAGALLREADSLASQLAEARSTLSEAGRASRLPAAIEGVSARPTADQLWQIEEAWKTAPRAIEALNRILTDRLPALEAKVYQAAARPQAIRAVELPRRAGS